MILGIHIFAACMPFSNYKEAVDYLYDALPMFQRVGPAALKKDLSNTIRLCEALGNPQRKFRSVHVAGTNGKGSVSHMVASILQSAGYKTGLYTSPHLKEFTERIRINGEEVNRDFVVDFVNRIKPHIETVKPSFFEITVVMAFEYFVSQSVDIAVIEVGMGGRLDSTNVIVPELSVITNIGYDHKELLGDTLPKIASEKAGIIKPHVTVVVSEYQAEVWSVFVDTAEAMRSKIILASDHFTCSPHSDGNVDVYRQGQLHLKDLDIPLKGDYQAKNVPAVLCAIEELRTRGIDVDDKSVREGLMQVVDQTGFKGRWQKIGSQPLIICDTGHNADGIRYIVRQITSLKYNKLFFVFGTVKDKDPGEVLSLLPKDGYYYFCQAKIPRAMDAKELYERAVSFGLRGEYSPDVRTAIRLAREHAGSGDFIFIGGSTFVVAEIEDI